VALAVPIYKGLDALRGRILPLLAALLAGGITSIVSAVGIAKLLGADAAIVGGFYAKSVTAPIAMGVAESIHVSPTLTAVFAVTTGILGAILVRFVLDAVGSKAWWQRGFALGVAAHGIGTSRAFSVHPEAGTYASLGMGLSRSNVFNRGRNPCPPTSCSAPGRIRASATSRIPRTAWTRHGNCVASMARSSPRSI
jgi:putative effector of murein hydrolase